MLKENKKTYNVIVAKYNENIDWINKMDKDKLVIYDKSDIPLENAIKRPNIGRDPETFIYHILRNYENLPDYLLFVQGNPFDHMINVNSGNFQIKINELIYSNNEISVEPLFTNNHFEHFTAYHYFNTNEYYSFFFEEKSPENFIFAAGCQYIVSKKNILNRTKKFYEKIYTMIHNGNVPHHNDVQHFDSNKIHVWCLERLLKYIFMDNIEISNKIKEILEKETF